MTTKKPLVLAIVFCPHCGVQHIDKGEWAEKNHSMHLCLKADGGCGRRFFTKSNVGVEADEDDALPSLVIDPAKTPLWRIWPASMPIEDNTPDPAHGTTGFHVHAWASKDDYEARKKSIDQTYEQVITPTAHYGAPHTTEDDDD